MEGKAILITTAALAVLVLASGCLEAEETFVVGLDEKGCVGEDNTITMNVSKPLDHDDAHALMASVVQQVGENCPDILLGSTGPAYEDVKQQGSEGEPYWVGDLYPEQDYGCFPIQIVINSDNTIEFVEICVEPPA